MKLGTLEKYNNIVIQMHDSPDADAMGSGYALYVYFKSKGKNVRLIYGGSKKISKSNILLMIKEMDIPVEYVEKLEKPELLITVDCQYGEGNVQYFEAENIAMVDHHNTGRMSGEMAEIRNHIVSCSTICFDMLMAEGFDINGNTSVATALYYGLFMDSNELSEISHPLEYDMIDFLQTDKALVNRLTHSNFTLEEMETAGIAMIRYSYDKNKRLSVIKSKPCDPNILGLVGDLVLQVDSIDVCVIFNESPEGYKLSVRSCVPDVAANDMAEFLTEGIGNGGGHIHKAGGFINKNKYIRVYGDMGIESYVFGRLEKYYDSYDVVYARDGIKNITGFELYRKKPYTYGYVKTTDLFHEGTQCKVRTYKGDVYVKASDKTYLIIGYYGEVHCLDREDLEKQYLLKNEKFQGSFEYAPSVRSLIDDMVYELIPYARQCVYREEVRILAKHLENPTKVFSERNEEQYMYGNSNDYICCSYNDRHDIYLVKKEVFEEAYSKM